MLISDNLRGAIYMNIAMAAFTLNDTAMKAVTQTLPLFQAITLRGVLTLSVLVAIGLATRGLQLNLGRRDMQVIATRTVAEVGATLLFLAALVHMPLANLSAIMQSLPLAVTLVAALVFGDAIGWRRLTAIGIGFIGVLIIIRPGSEGFDIWSVFGLGSVACVVVRDLATRELSRDVPSVTVAVWAAGSVTALGIVGTFWQGWLAVSAKDALQIAGAAAALIVGYLYVIKVMRVGDIGFIAPFRYMALLWAIVLGWIAFDTLPDKWTLLGSAIVVATGMFTLWRERKRRATAQS